MFAFLRMRLLQEFEGGGQPALHMTLAGLLALLPQGPAFGLLERRLKSAGISDLCKLTGYCHPDGLQPLPLPWRNEPRRYSTPGVQPETRVAERNMEAAKKWQERLNGCLRQFQEVLRLKDAH